MADALSAYRYDRVRQKYLGEVVKSAQRSAELHAEAFRAGEVTLTDLLIAKQKSFSAQLSQLEGRQTLAVDAVALYRALGGGWEAADYLRATRHAGCCPPQPVLRIRQPVQEERPEPAKKPRYLPPPNLFGGAILMQPVTVLPASLPAATLRFEIGEDRAVPSSAHTTDFDVADCLE